jgi:hypothetical protein
MDEENQTPAADEQPKPAADAGNPAGDKGAAPSEAPPADTGADGKPSAETGKPEGAAQTTPAAPEKYDLKVPEAAAAYLDAADRKTLEDAYRKAGFSNDEAQVALDNYIASVDAQARRMFEETKADPVYGGDNLPETQRLARLAVDRLRPADHPRRAAFEALLARGGTGNHIEVISFLADLGKAMAEDKPTSGKASTGSAPRSAAEVLFGDAK